MEGGGPFRHVHPDWVAQRPQGYGSQWHCGMPNPQFYPHGVGLLPPNSDGMQEGGEVGATAGDQGWDVWVRVHRGNGGIVVTPAITGRRPTIHDQVAATQLEQRLEQQNTP
eukprot:428375-Rhodomonas_salina.1